MKFGGSFNGDWSLKKYKSGKERDFTGEDGQGHEVVLLPLKNLRRQDYYCVLTGLQKYIYQIKLKVLLKHSVLVLFTL